MTQHLKLMADYSAYPIWLDEEGAGYSIDPATLPISSELANRLLAWADIYHATLNLENPATSGFTSSQEEDEFEKEGVQLWLQLKRELGSDYEVSYFSERKRKVLRNPSEL